MVSRKCSVLYAASGINQKNRQFLRTACFLFPIHNCLSAKQKRNAPKTGQTDYGVYQAAEEGTGAAKQPSNKVKLKDPNEAPVQTAYYRQDQRNGIHTKPPFHFADVSRIC